MLGDLFEGPDEGRQGDSRMAVNVSLRSRATSTPLPRAADQYVTVDAARSGRQSPNTTWGEEGRAPPGFEERMERMFATMADTFAAALDRVATASSSGPPRALPLPEFRGAEHESAQDFLFRMEDYFFQMRVTDTAVKLALSGNQLRGPAKTWYEPYKYLFSTYETFADRLREKYDSSENVTQAITQLYGERQKRGEDAAVFMTRKMCLFNRVAQGQSEETRISIVLDLLDPELSSRIRGHSFRSLEHLITLASKVEADLRRAASRPSGRPTERHNQSNNQGRSQHAPVSDRAPQGVNSENRRREPERNVPRTPCRYCPGEQYHFHNECRNNPYRDRGPVNNMNRQQASGQSSWQNRGPRAGGPPNQARNRAAPPRNPPPAGGNQGNHERAAGGDAPARNQ